MKYIFLLITLTSLVPVLSHAAEDDARKYQKCMDLVESNAAEAVTYANDWIFDGAGLASGGVPAGHCKALGLLAQGQAQAAAKLLEKLVEDMVINGDPAPMLVQKNARLKVQLNAQAALAWKQAGNFDKSYMAYSSALSGIGENPSAYDRTLLHDLYLQRGTLQILRGQYKAAIEDFTLALEKDDRQFEAFLQRAKAYRKKHNYLKAGFDLKVATKLAGNYPDILLEKGILYRAEGRKLDARIVWQKIIELYPKSEYAKLAQTNIDLLKVD